MFEIPGNNEISIIRLINTTKSVLSKQMQPVAQHLTVNLVHFIPHRPVIKEEAEATNGWIVYDCSTEGKLRYTITKWVLGDRTQSLIEIIQHDCTLLIQHGYSDLITV